MSDPIQFAAFGHNTTAAATDSTDDFICKQQLQLADDSAKARRSWASQGQLQRLEALPGEDVMKLTIANPKGGELVLWLHPDNARALLLSQHGAVTDQYGAVQFPLNASWRGPALHSQRNLLSDITFKTLELFGWSGKTALAELTAKKLGAKIDSQVQEGVYRLNKGEIPKLKGLPSCRVDAVKEPVLVLIHGTFVDTFSSFGKWWLNRRQLADELFAAYHDQVYALDHATVLKSPLHNALTLVNALPNGARLHLVTHSRGGLVAECLVRASMLIDEHDKNLFSKPGYEQHLADLVALSTQMRQKNINVECVVRAACPAHGTLLASDRLDSYLSVLVWLLEQSKLPVLPELLDFVKAVARERTDPQTLAGIEAMRNDSPVIQWLNRPIPSGLNSRLRVIAGDLEADSLFSWAKVLLADSFYRTENDLVVQTSAMYGGVLRADARFLLERGSSTNHFNYFANLSTANAMLEALTKDLPAGFTPIGPLSQQGKDSFGKRAGYHPAVLQPGVDGTATKPLVLVLPGITGSHLKQGQQREWLVLHRAFGLLDSISMDQPDITPDGPIDLYYQDLIEQLALKYEVLPFAFDWRVSLRESAATLAKVLSQQMAFRGASAIHMVAHSMGSQVFRVLQLEHNEIWQQWLQRPDTRVVLLGPPNQGSWAPMTMLTGDDPMATVLSGLSGDLGTLKTRNEIARFQGLLEMQAGMLDSRYQLSSISSWRRLATLDQQVAEQRSPWFSRISSAHKWALPSPAMLEDISILRARLNGQHAELQKFKNKISIILGSSTETPCGVTSDPMRGVEYEFTKAGDGRVTWENALIEGIPSWLSSAEHGDLPKDKAVISACLNLLAQQPVQNHRTLKPYGQQQRGKSSQDQMVWRKDRGLCRTASKLWLPANNEQLIRSLTNTSLCTPASNIERPVLQLEVYNGDLRFIRQPLLLGHQTSIELTGSEYVVNQMLAGDLSRALYCGIYPALPGQFQIFINRHVNEKNPLAYPRPTAAIVVGLGDEGELTPAVIQHAVCSGVLGYCLQLAGPPEGIDLAATTLGSGGILTVSQSVEALVQGVLEANLRLNQLNEGRAASWVAKLVIVEQYHNRALEAWHKLNSCQRLSKSMPISLAEQVICGNSAVSQPIDGHYRGAKYDLIRITERAIGADYLLLEFALFTRRARSEIYFKKLQKGQVEILLHNAEQSGAFDPELARTLFQLIFPHELKVSLRTAGDLVLELDEYTARYPWEMLDDRTEQRRLTEERPWALAGEGALLRKLRLSSFRRQPVPALSLKVLVVGEPLCEAPALPAAAEEAQLVAGIFGPAAQLLLHSSSSEVFKAALSSPWQVMHLAGHGVYLPDSDKANCKSGLVLENGIVFGPAEFESMLTTPELVFINCCELGKVDGNFEPIFPEFAANVAQQLIQNGVRCVVAAGWAVGDSAASEFAAAFYKTLMNGYPFATAVQMGRLAAYNLNNADNTWAAYQCYGDPGWRMMNSTNANSGTEPLILASPSEFLVAMELLRTQAESTTAAHKAVLQAELQTQLRNVPANWLAQGRIAEAVAKVWVMLEDTIQALYWYEQAVMASDGSASLVAHEQRLNWMVRVHHDDPQKLQLAVTALKKLLDLAKTSERYCLLGSAYKRLVISADREPDVAAQQQFLPKMQQAYQRAAVLAAQNQYYPICNDYLARLRLHWSGSTEVTVPEAADWQHLQSLLKADAAENPDFWNHVGQIELHIWQALLEQNLSVHLSTICAELQQLQLAVNNSGYWSSVFDTANLILPFYRDLTGLPAEELRAVDALLQLLVQLSGSEQKVKNG